MYQYKKSNRGERVRQRERTGDDRCVMCRRGCVVPEMHGLCCLKSLYRPSDIKFYIKVTSDSLLKDKQRLSNNYHRLFESILRIKLNVSI